MANRIKWGDYTPFGDFVGRNMEPNCHRFDRKGKNLSVGNTPEDLWALGGRMTWLTAASTMEIVSSSGSDTAAGVGAQFILINGVDADYEPISEFLATNGTSAATTVNSYLRINRILVVAAGSTGYNVGNITIRDSAGSNAQAYMEVEHNVSQGMNFTVPAGYHMVITNVAYAAETGQDVELEPYILAAGSGFTLWANFGDDLIPGGRSTFTRNIYSLIPEKTDVNLRVKKLSGTSGACVVSYTGYLIKGNEYINTNGPHPIGF